ncbi:TIGR00296 family protein [Thermoproteota archaeon]
MFIKKYFIKCRKEVTKLFTLTDQQGEYLVQLARQVIENKLGLTQASITEHNDLVYNEKCGVFVTLNIHAKGSYGLRGCIGLPYPTKPLIDAVKEAAESSAFSDPRFPPVQSNEVYRITIEVSVLTPPELIEVDNPLDYPSYIKVGRDGLIIGKGWRRGLLLPQVPVEWGWNSVEFLSQCCVKAGLPKDEWKKQETEIYSFQAILFKEKVPNGKVIRHQIS